MKKYLSLILTLIFVINVCFSTPFTLKANAASVDDLTFELNSDGQSYCVARCDTSASGEIEIPDTYNDLPVTSIGQEAFCECSSLTSISLPDSVTDIGAYAFLGCESLTSINIPDGVTSIGDCTFNFCISLENITIPDSVTSIGESAFYECTSLASITIPDSVTSIGESAFYECTSLASITIPDSVTSIGYRAFRSCSSLANVNITDLAAWCDIDFAEYYDSNPLYYAKNLYLNGELITDLVIPAGVTEIKAQAFFGCSSLTSVNIPNSVTNIGSSAFNSCTSLTSVNIPNSVTNIGSSAFNNCTSLTNITIPDSVTIIGDYAFYMCSSLTTITIPKSVTSIGECAFNNSSLIEINVSSENNNFTSADGVLFNKNKTILIKMPKCTKITSYIIPDGVTSIGKEAFSNCYSLTSITLPDSVTSIGNDAFSHCTNLETITMPGNVTSIGKYTFYDCYELKSVTIPNGVTSIGYGAFYNCTSLASLTIPNSVTSIDSYAFANCKALEYVFYTGSSTDWRNINIINSGNDYLIFNSIHYNSTKHSHSLTTHLPTSANNYGYITDKCPICGFCNSMTMVVYINDYIAAVGDKNVVIDSTNNYIILDISASQDLSEAILPMDGYTLITTPSSDYGFFGTGSKVQVTDSNGTQVAEYTLVVRGDVNGDSVCDVFDLMVMQSATNNPTTLEGAYFVAGDLTEEGEITDTDFEAVVTKALF